MNLKKNKIKFDSSLIFLSVSLILVLSVVLVYFVVKTFVFNDPSGIFVATPSGVTSLTISPASPVAMNSSETKTFSVVISGIPTGAKISAIGFSLKVAGGATVSNLKINTALETAAQVKQFDLTVDRMNFAVATSYTQPFTLSNGQTVATFDLKAPATTGTILNVITNISTSALPSIIDSTGVEIMKSDTSLLPVNLTVTNPTLANPTYSFTTDTVYNSSLSVIIDVPGVTGETIKYCTTSSNTTPCTPTIAVTPGTAFTFTNATPVYLYSQADLTGYVSSKAYSPKLTLNDVPSIASLTFSTSTGPTSLTFTSGDNVTISANNVTDTINGVTKVSFYDGTTLLGEDTTSPYTYVLNNISIGAHVIKAEAVDAYAAKGSVTVTITANPKAPTFTPNGGVSSTPFSVTINNPNGTGTVKYSLCDNCAPVTTYSTPVSVTTSNKLTANVTVNGIVSSNAVSSQYTVTGKVAAPVLSPTQGNYHPSLLTTLSMSSSTSGAAIKYCMVSFTAATETSATCVPNIDYTAPDVFSKGVNYKVIALATKADWTNSDTVTAIYKVKGDTNTDNKIDLQDVLKTLNAVFDATLATPLMDLNKTTIGFGDGKVDLFDILEILSVMFN